MKRKGSDESRSPVAILRDPLTNKGTAFTQEERDELKLNGFLPYGISTLELQLKRAYQSFSSQTTDIGKYVFLAALQDKNERLFFRLVSDYASEMLPFIYTPTVGDVSLHYSHMFRRTRGIFFSYPLKDRFDEIVANIPQDEVDVIVATDGERILGLGDLGAGGIAISLGKLSLYSLFGGIRPDRTLPVLIDVGTNNEQLLNDPLYIGWKNRRVTGKDYDACIEAFVQAIKKRWPQAMIQWEDFGKSNAYRILDKYRNKTCSFNDDIQGTAAVALAAILTAAKVRKASLADERIVVLGGGSAGVGICQQLCAALIEKGLSPEEARKRFYVVDICGLVHKGVPGVEAHHHPFIHSESDLAHWNVADRSHITLQEVVAHMKPTVLIGTSTQKDAFTEEIVRTMYKHVKRPVILPLSNPTSKCEAHPENLMKWTEGNAIVATGSPFKPVTHNGKTFTITQCNNVYIFPGVGLGVVASGATRVSDKMFHRAAETLSDFSPMLADPCDSLFPKFEMLRAVTKRIAIEVGLQAQDEGVAPKVTLEELTLKVEQAMWTPEY